MVNKYSKRKTVKHNPGGHSFMVGGGTPIDSEEFSKKMKAAGGMMAKKLYGRWAPLLCVAWSVTTCHTRGVFPV